MVLSVTSWYPRNGPDLGALKLAFDHVSSTLTVVAAPLFARGEEGKPGVVIPMRITCGV